MKSFLSTFFRSLGRRATGKLIRDLKGHKEPLVSSRFSTDGKKIITTSWDNTTKVWDIVSGKMLVDFNKHNDVVISEQPSPDGKRIITASFDNTVRVWSITTGRLFYTFFPVDSVDYFAQSSSGYYQTTSSAAKLLHYVTKDLKIITFEQLD